MIKPNYMDLIETIIHLYEPKNYLELGVQYGRTFLRMAQIVPYSVAVDINKLFNIDTSYPGSFFVGTTEAFYKQNKDKFDMIFIDACHSIDSVRFDFIHSLEILNPNGVLILHDTNPSSKVFIGESYCRDAYKIVDEIDTDKYFTFTFPTDTSGLTIVSLKSNRRCLSFI